MNVWYSLILIFFISTIGCKSHEQGGEFSREGVSFTYPQGWRISEEEDLENGFYISVEKAGYDQSGLFMLTGINGNVGLENYLQTLIEGYTNQKALNNLEFEDIKEDTFNGIPSISCAFTFSVLGLEHTGKIYVFEDENRTYSIVKQEAIEDIPNNQNGYEIMENSFGMEK